jgi:hypothetical protein
VVTLHSPAITPRLWIREQSISVVPAFSRNHETNLVFSEVQITFRWSWRPANGRTVVKRLRKASSSLWSVKPHATTWLSQLQLGFDIVTVTRAVTSKWSPGSSLSVVTVMR